MADILEKIAKTEGNENEISLGELEKHFDEITKDKENDDNQIGKLIKAFEKNIDKNSEKFLNPKDIIKEILDKDSFSIIKYTPNLIKVYQLCKRLEDKQERKIDGELPQEMIKDWVTEKQKNAGTFSSESIYYDDQQQNLVIKTPFGEYTQPFQESEKGTVKVNNMDKTIPDISYIPGILSDFFTIIDSEENMKKIIKEQRVILFDAFIQANSNPDKEGTDVEDISLSEDGVMTVEIGNDDVEIYIKETKNISKMTSEEVLEYIHEKRTDFKDDKNVRNAENAQLNAMIDQKVFSDTDMDFINTWCKDKNHKEQQPKKIAKIQDTMNGRIDDMMSQKITPKLVNAGNADVYDSSDIKMIQLRANICFDENLLLDGNRGALFYSGNNTENQKITNMYIYRNELKTRSESMDIRKLSNKVVFDKLLDLPNLDALLQNLGDNDIQNKVFGQFLKFFLEVRVAGQYFENLIGSERLESVLVCMINAELLKNTSPSEYFADIDIQKIQQANAEKKLNKDSVEYLLLQMREIIEKGKFETMGKYYEYIYTTSTNEIIAINKNNTTNNNIKAIANEITKLEGELEGLDKEERYQPAATVLTLTEADKQQITIDRQNINRVKLPDQLTITPESNRIETPWGKKKIEIIEKKLQIYEINKNSDYLFNVIYMDIKGSFSEKDIQKLFSMERITKYGVSHQDYLSKTAKLNEELDQKLEEKQQVLDIISQFEAEGSLEMVRPTWQEFTINFYAEYQELLREHGQSLDLRDSSVPFNVGKLLIPGLKEPVYVKNSYLPIEKPGKKIVVISIENKKDITNNVDIKNIPRGENEKKVEYGYSFKDNKGNIIIEDFVGNEIKRITVLEQESANEVQNIAMGNVYDRELREINKSFETFDKDFSPMMEILNDFQQKGENDDGIDSKQRDELKYSADDFLRNKLYKYENDVSFWKEQVKKLEAMKSSGMLKNTFEENVNVQISTLNEMINLFSVTDGTSPIKGILTAMTEVSENDDGYEKVWVWLKDHGIQTLIAIAGAVAAIVLAAPSGGTSVWAYIQGMTLFSAAVGTLGGMVGSRIGQAMNEGIRNCPLWDNEINGRVYEYDNPTDVELWLTNKMSSADFFTGLGTEFLIGTITTFGFMKAGQIIGNAIAKSGIINNVGNLRPSVQVGKLIDFGKKIIFRNVNSVANNSMETFAKAFTREVSEETFEESIENVGKNINPILGGIITMLNCLSGPSAGKIFQDHNVAGGKTDIVGNQIIQEMTYRAENISQLEKYFIDQEYKKIISENGEIQYVKPMETAETIYKPDGSTKVLNEHVIKLKYSNAGTFVNNSAEFFAKYGMEVNHDVENEVTVDDPKKIQAFKVAVGMGNMGVVTINPDGSAKFTTGKNTIHIKVVTENVITTNTSITETQVNPTLSTETVNNVNNVIKEVEDNQNMLESDTDVEQMTEPEKITLVDQVKIKIFTLITSLSGKTEADVLHDIGTYMFNNVKHFLHECKSVFGTQLVDVYKSYVQMKKYSGKPGDAEFQKVFQAKVKERGINLTKLVGVGALAKLGIDPNLFTWSGHLIADQLQQHIPFFDKLFSLSFDTMNELYSRKKGKNTMYNPQTVIENSLLDQDVRRQKIAEELGLDVNDAKNQQLLNALQEAHEVGQDGPGKNPEYSPGVYNYTTEQIRQKMEILKPFIDNGSITLEQVRMLFERGYLGKNAVKVDVVENVMTQTEETIGDMTNTENIGTMAIAPDATTINNLLKEYENEADKTKKNEIKDNIRSEFELYAKKFQEYMTNMKKEIDALESAKPPKYEEAFAKKKEIHENSKLMFGDTLPKIIGDLSDIKGMKTFLKSTNFREISDRLSSIQTQIKNGNTRLANKLIKDFNKVMAKADADLVNKLGLGILTIDNVAAFQTSFEKNPTVDKYNKMMMLMVNPEYEAIRIEQTVYAKETAIDYKARMESNLSLQESLRGQKVNEKNKTKISQDITSKALNSEKIGPINKASIEELVNKTLDVCQKLNLDAEASHKLCMMLAEHHTFQTIESSKRQLGDHGERHITGNIEIIENMMTSLGGTMDPKIQLMTILGMSGHDMGYAVKISAGVDQYTGTDIHPFTSANLFTSYYGPILTDLGLSDLTPKIANMITNHDGTYFDLSSPEAQWLTVCKLADNFALFSSEKFPPFLMDNPKYIQDLYEIAKISQFTEKNAISKEQRQALKDKINADDSINPDLKKNYEKFIDEMSPRTFKTMFGMMEASLDFNSFSTTVVNGKTVTTVTIQRNNSVIDEVYNNVGDQIGKPFEDYFDGGNILRDIEGNIITDKKQIRTAIEAGGIIMIDNAGNKLIYNVENVTYNNVTYSNGNEINLLEKTNQELSDLSQEKQNRIKEINDSLKVVTDPDAQVALKKELLRLQNEVMKIETQLYSNKIVEDARAREELAATKDMAKNTKRYADIPSEIRELETKLQKAVTDADKQKIQEKIDALKEEMKEIPIEQSNKFNDTFTKEYVNQLNQKYDALVNKKDGELKSLREEIQSGNLDADTKMKKIDDFNAKVAAIPTVDIKVAKTAADLVVENTNKAKDAK